MMATKSKRQDEHEAITFLQDRLHQLDLNAEIKTLHLNSNIINEPTCNQHKITHMSHQNNNGFWQKFEIALQHISHLDPHAIKQQQSCL